MTWDQYHKLYGDIYRLHKKYKEAATADADGMTADAAAIYEKYGGDGFALGLIEAVMQDLLAEPDKGWQMVIKNSALF